jgi:NAD(P)-dependent dehydrogenase (short-subunit alcohol dehydrogenase family)
MPDGAFSLSGRVALVTGAGGGIGAPTAWFLAAQGAYVVVNNLAVEAAEPVVDSIGSNRAVAT